VASIPLKTRDEIELMRQSGRIVAEVLKLMSVAVRPGVTTLELDRLAEEYIRSQGAVPAFKGYGSRDNPFPATLCVSLDSVVVHGIPSVRTLKEGELISIDVGVKKSGFFGDGAWSFAVGEVSAEKQRLMRVTEESLMAGIAMAVVGKRVHDISAAVQQHVEANGFSVVRDLCGHGVGRKLHEDPSVPNFGQAGTGARIQEGMTLAIEPMVNAGAWRVVLEQDGWTVRTADGKPSAHYEHTVAVINGLPEILTVT
jgi:methionyl aminopeptidase